MAVITESKETLMTKITNRAFIVDSEKAEEFIQLKPQKAVLDRIKKKSTKMRKRIVKDERTNK